MVSFPLGLRGYVTESFDHGLPSFGRVACPGPYVLACHAFRGGLGPHTVLFIQCDSVALFSNVPWENTVDEARGAGR